MMSSRGWKDLLEDLTAMRMEYENIRNCDTGDKLQFRKGQVDILDYLIGLKDLSERAYEELNNEKNI